MQKPLTIIDSFNVSAEKIDLRAGKWFVLDGTFVSASELPEPGAHVEVATPEGHHFAATVEGVEIRHGTGALIFFSQEFDALPRLSVITRGTA